MIYLMKILGLLLLKTNSRDGSFCLISYKLGGKQNVPLPI